MGRVGACADKAAMESFFSLLQKNVLDCQRWLTRQELRLRSRHGSNGPTTAGDGIDTWDSRQSNMTQSTGPRPQPPKTPSQQKLGSPVPHYKCGPVGNRDEKTESILGSVTPPDQLGSGPLLRTLFKQVLRIRGIRVGFRPGVEQMLDVSAPTSWVTQWSFGSHKPPNDPESDDVYVALP